MRPIHVAAAALLFTASPAHAQERVLDAGVLRFFQGSSEVGRETFRRTTNQLTTETVVPVLDLKLSYVIDLTRDGRLTAMEAVAWSVTGDTLIRRYTARADGDSLQLMQEESNGSQRTWAAAAQPTAGLGTQSIAGLADLILRAHRQDTIFSVWSPEENGVNDISVSFSGDTARVQAGPLLVIAPIDAAGRAVSLSLPAGGLSATRAGTETLAPLPGIARPEPDYAPSPGDRYRAEDVRVPVRPAIGEGFDLAGTLTVPLASSPPWPAVVLITGSGGQDRDESLWPLLPEYKPFRQIAARLAREGIATLRVDDRSVGSSGGDASGATTADLADDVRAQVAWLRARPDIDRDRVVLAGHSEGGAIAPMVAADDAEIAAIVLLAGPGKPGRDIIRDQLLWPLNKAEGMTPTELETVRTATLGEMDSIRDLNPWMEWFWDYDPLSTARRVRQPALILQGAFDRQVSAGQADTLATAMREAGNQDVEIHIFPRLNHLFLESLEDGSPSEYAAIQDVAVPDRVLDLLADWLARQFRLRR